MAAPEVPIDVDAGTGAWTTDGMAMIYMPRHFFVGNHQAVEAALGKARHGEILHEAGHAAAFAWCAAAARAGGLAGLDVFHHYLARLSQRGWGRFRALSVDAAAGRALVRLDHSVFVAESPHGGDGLCTLFAGWFAGALAWVDTQNGLQRTLAGGETQCAGAGADHCLFEVTPRDGP